MLPDGALRCPRSPLLALHMFSTSNKSVNSTVIPNVTEIFQILFDSPPYEQLHRYTQQDFAPSDASVRFIGITGEGALGIKAGGCITAWLIASTFRRSSWICTGSVLAAGGFWFSLASISYRTKLEYLQDIVTSVSSKPDS